MKKEVRFEKPVERKQSSDVIDQKYEDKTLKEIKREQLIENAAEQLQTSHEQEKLYV